MAKHKSLDSLFSAIKDELADSMRKHVAPEVKHIQSIMIQEHVYDVYNVIGGNKQEPYVYERRGTSGGLADTQNMIEEVDRIGNEVVLSVTNRTKGQDQTSLYIAPLVEYGDGAGYGEYQYKTNRDDTSYQYLQARPFTQKTVDRLRETNIHIDKLRDSLKSKGYKIK